MSRPAVTVLCDFDGTITTTDIGSALCERFAPGALARANSLWRSGALSFGEASVAAWQEMRATEEEVVAHALATAEVREGFSELVEACRSLGARLVVASAGLDVYVKPVLERHLGPAAAGLELHVNPGRITPDGIEMEMPHRDPSCPQCANCKGLRARLARREGSLVVAVGDSFSDACVVPEADVLFARDWLLEHCLSLGLAHRPWTELDEVTAHLRAVLTPGR